MLGGLSNKKACDFPYLPQARKSHEIPFLLRV